MDKTGLDHSNLHQSPALYNDADKRVEDANGTDTVPYPSMRDVRRVAKAAADRALDVKNEKFGDKQKSPGEEKEVEDLEKDLDTN